MLSSKYLFFLLEYVVITHPLTLSNVLSGCSFQLVSSLNASGVFNDLHLVVLVLEKSIAFKEQSTTEPNDLSN